MVVSFYYELDVINVINDPSDSGKVLGFDCSVKHNGEDQTGLEYKFFTMDVKNSRVLINNAAWSSVNSLWKVRFLLPIAKEGLILIRVYDLFYGRFSDRILVYLDAIFDSGECEFDIEINNDVGEYLLGANLPEVDGFEELNVGETIDVREWKPVTYASKLQYSSVKPHLTYFPGDTIKLKLKLKDIFFRDVDGNFEVTVKGKRLG